MSDGDKTCRTCGKPSDQEDATDLFPMFTSTEYNNELSMILSEFEIWNLNISENDGLPQKICLTCFDSFCQIHNFRIMCEEAQMNFGELCTGLDIIIKMEPEFSGDLDADFPEDFQGEQIITIQEHYQFPRNERFKVSESTTNKPQNINVCNKQGESENEDDKEQARQNEIDEMNVEVAEFKRYRCEYCMDIVSFDDPDLLNDHYNVLHSTDTPYLCPKCDKCYNTKPKRDIHARTHYRIMVECDICGKKVRGGKPIMAQHNELHHVEMDRECPTCGKIFLKATLKTFNYHMSWHDDAKLHKCKYCEKKFVQVTHLVVHEKSHTGACVYQCDECGIGFANDELLKSHLKLHDLKKSDIPAEARNSHEADVKVDTQTKSTRCEICDKSFRSVVNLRLHSYKKHGVTPSRPTKDIMKPLQNFPVDNPYKCNKCPESFLMHTQLVIHLKSHQNNRPYKCHNCPKTFKKDRYRRIHNDTVHLKKKQFICSACGCGFKYKQILDEHVAVKHGTSKDFKCDICDKAFAFEKALKNHALKHKELKPFACTVCTKSYTTAGVLKAHVKLHQKNSAKIPEKYVVELMEQF